MILLKSTYYNFRRMLRNYLGMVILLVTPIALITVLGLLADDAMNETLGIPIKDEIVVIMVFAFLMFGGFYTMEYVKGDLMSSMKWRMHSLPYQAHTHAYSILISSSLFNVLQSFIIVIYTLFVYDVHWGNLWLVFLILLTVSTFIQFVFINLVLGVKNYKTAERLGTAFGIGSVMLAEVWFKMPDIAPFPLLSTYGNPFSLGKNMIFANMTGENTDKALISLVILIIATIILAISTAYFGRRKLL